MTLRTTVFIATSHDGYIARPDGAIDWLEHANQHVPAGEDCGYAAHMATVDLLVMGRGTFEKVLSFPEWPFPDKPVWVASRTGRGLTDDLPPQVRITGESPAQIVRTAVEHAHHRGQVLQNHISPLRPKPASRKRRQKFSILLPLLTRPDQMSLSGLSRSGCARSVWLHRARCPMCGSDRRARRPKQARTKTRRNSG